MCSYIQAREFASELRASTKASRNPTVWLEASSGPGQTAKSADTSNVSEAYSKMLTIFIPLLVDEVIIFTCSCIGSWNGVCCLYAKMALYSH